MENVVTKVATEQLLVRLENLLTALMHIRSAEGLMDRLSEGGLICSELMELKILEHDDYMVTLSAHAKQNKQVSETCDYAHYQLFERAAQVYSKRERLLLRPMPSQSVSQAEIDIIKRIAHERNLNDYVVVIRDLFPTDLSVSVDSPAEPNSLKIYTTDWASDFEEQGQRYGHFVSELIAKLKGQQTQLSCEENSEVLADLQRRQKPLTVAPTPTPIPKEYENLWAYATKKWSKGHDFYKICESVSEGPGNYTDCVNSLLPNTNRSAQTTRFHSVVGELNKILRPELQVEVRREPPRGEQVLVQNVNRATREKSCTKRKR